MAMTVKQMDFAAVAAEGVRLQRELDELVASFNPRVYNEKARFMVELPLWQLKKNPSIFNYMREYRPLSNLRSRLHNSEEGENTMIAVYFGDKMEAKHFRNLVNEAFNLRWLLHPRRWLDDFSKLTQVRKGPDWGEHHA